MDQILALHNMCCYQNVSQTILTQVLMTKYLIIYQLTDNPYSILYTHCLFEHSYYQNDQY